MGISDVRGSFSVFSGVTFSGSKDVHSGLSFSHEQTILGDVRSLTACPFRRYRC